MATATQTTSATHATITAKLAELIKKTDAWRRALAEAATAQQNATKETTTLIEQLTEAMQDSINIAQQLTEKVESVGATAARMRAEWQTTSGAATSAFDLFRDASKNPFAASDYISGASLLTTEQKAEFLRIIKDRDQEALLKLIEDYKAQINKIYGDEYQSLKDQQEKFDRERRFIGDQINGLLASIKGKEGTTYYDNSIKEIAKLRQNIQSLSQKSNVLTLRIGQYTQDALRLEGQLSVLSRAWDDDSMRLALESGARGKESEGYSKDELLWLVNKALETGAGSKFDNVALTELIKKLNSSIPEKLYKLDLTAGDQKLSAFTDLSPEKFLEALFTARKSALL